MSKQSDVEQRTIAFALFDREAARLNMLPKSSGAAFNPELGPIYMKQACEELALPPRLFNKFFEKWKAQQSQR
jgi:hypothetical protein